MGQLKRKCYATPRWEKFCDGCETNSTKCPFRYKTRDNRTKRKRDDRNMIKRAETEEK